MVRVALSTSGEAKRARIRRLPRLLEAEIRAVLRRDAVGVIAGFQDGIRNNTLRLERLSRGTIAEKIRKGFAQPRVPLYGLGDGTERSYVNMMLLRRLKNGWQVVPSRRRHHESDLRLSDLFVVHEFGATINTGTATIRIPPRPALREAFRVWMRGRKRGEPAAEVRRAITAIVRDGDHSAHRRIVKRRSEAEFGVRQLKEI